MGDVESPQLGARDTTNGEEHVRTGLLVSLLLLVPVLIAWTGEAEQYLRQADGLLYSQGRLDEAVVAYDRAIDLDPKLVQAYIGRGEAYRRLGEWDKAIADAETAMRLDPGSFCLDSGRFCPWGAYHQRAQARMVLGDYEGAVADLSRVIELDPTVASAYLNRAVAHCNLKEFVEALADADRAIELDPDLKVPTSTAESKVVPEGCFKIGPP